MKYIEPKKYYRKLKLKKISKGLKLTGLIIMTATALFILYICTTSGDDTKKINKCLQNHDLEYCNKEVR